MSFSDFPIEVSGASVKSAAQAFLNRDELEPISDRELVAQIKTLEANVRTDDRYTLSINQLRILGM
jgi:hypothetical protein